MGANVYELDSLWGIYAAGGLPAYVREIATGTIIRYNQALAELTGYVHAELPDMDAWFQTLYPDPKEQHRARELVAEFISGKREQYDAPMFITLKNGTRREVEFHINQTVSEHHKPNLHLVTVIDMAERAQATRQLVHLNRLLDQMIQERSRQLEESRQRLALALEGADEGIWEIDFAGGEMRFTTEIPLMLGYDLDEMGTTPETWDKLNHPEDWPKVEKALKAHFQGKTDHYEAEYRVRAKSGEWRWIMGRGRVTQRDAKGRPLKAVGTHVNIDKIKRAEEELKLKSQRLEEMNTALRVLLAQRDADRTEMEEKILSNVKTLVAPYLDQLEGTLKTDLQRNYLAVLRSNLEDIVSPFTQKLTSKYMGFTPREIQVADLIRSGRGTKDIAQTLLISESAVEFHRHNVRRKLGIVDKKVNLHTYLKTLQ